MVKLTTFQHRLTIILTNDGSITDAFMRQGVNICQMDTLNGFKGWVFGNM